MFGSHCNENNSHLWMTVNNAETTNVAKNLGLFLDK